MLRLHWTLNSSGSFQSEPTNEMNIADLFAEELVQYNEEDLYLKSLWRRWQSAQVGKFLSFHLHPYILVYSCLLFQILYFFKLKIFVHSWIFVLCDCLFSCPFISKSLQASISLHTNVDKKALKNLSFIWLLLTRSSFVNQGKPKTFEELPTIFFSSVLWLSCCWILWLAKALAPLPAWLIRT